MYEESEIVVRCAVGTTQGQGQTVPGISAKFVSVCSDNGQANE